MRRYLPPVMLILALLAAAALGDAMPASAGGAPTAHAAKKCKKKHKKACKKKKKKPKKPKIFKPRTYEGSVVSTNPSAPSTSQITLLVRRSECQPVTGGKAKSGICLTASISGEYPTSCTKNGRLLAGNGPSGIVTADYLLPATGVGELTFHQDPEPPPPPAAQDTIETTNKYKITAQQITGTAVIHMVFQNTDGDMICDGSATFDLKRTQ